MNNAYANDWQINQNVQSKRDLDRTSILQKELSNEMKLLNKAKLSLNNAISSKNPVEHINLSIARHNANIDSLNKELGIKSVSSQIYKNKPLPELAVKNPDIQVQPTLNFNQKPNIPIPTFKASQKFSAKNTNLVKFRGKLISPALAQVYDSPLN